MNCFWVINAAKTSSVLFANQSISTTKHCFHPNKRWLVWLAGWLAGWKPWRWIVEGKSQKSGTYSFITFCSFFLSSSFFHSFFFIRTAANFSSSSILELLPAYYSSLLFLQPWFSFLLLFLFFLVRTLKLYKKLDKQCLKWPFFWHIVWTERATNVWFVLFLKNILTPICSDT